MIYFCCQDRRRGAIAAHPIINGIDFLEVHDGPSVPDVDKQRTLVVHFIKPLVPASLTPANVRIDGGERILNIGVTAVSVGSGAQANVLTVNVSAPGDFSTYTLHIIDPKTPDSPPAGFDRLFSAIDFSFKIACPNDFDCSASHVCPPAAQDLPAINYQAKDYQSFRQMMLDRIAVTAPGWQERNPADVGVVLVELLAYVADYLSYRQDAIATEAYLGTVRRRISARRHARLVDYRMSDGLNARTWVHIEVSSDTTLLPAHSQLLTKLRNVNPRIAPNDPGLERMLDQSLVVFETMADSPRLFAAHNEIQFYTWGALECCLPKGATRATLAGTFPHLNAGDVLIFEEVLGPGAGTAVDADPSHRCAVQLTRVAVTQDDLGGRFADPPNNDPVAITEIEWRAGDALSFAMCLSGRTDAAHGASVITGMSVARGNIVQADHGRTVANEALPAVPAPTLFVLPTDANRCSAPAPDPVLARYRPKLARGPLTQIATDAGSLPSISLRDTSGRSWTIMPDLMASGPLATDFAVEVDDDARGVLCFGDDTNGARPAAGASFTATYRVGNGSAGNIGSDTLAHVVSNDPSITEVRNPLAASGGADPETIEDVRQRAPAAFRTQRRAVTADDYALVAGRHSGVQRAAATFRWTGSWRTVFVTVERAGGQVVDTPFEQDMSAFLDSFRMAGHDVEIDSPVFVPLEVNMTVCVDPDYFASDVEQALLDIFNNRTGIFSQYNFTFGRTVYVSPLYAAAQNVTGVSSALITIFQRLNSPSTSGLKTGSLPMGRLEIARLDNDPNFPERGVFRLQMQGGK
jgi:hypothetical protein